MYKILLVDDEPIIILALRKMLRNFETVTVQAECANGSEALTYLNAHPDIDIVITDVDMPVMTGLELAEELKKQKKQQSLIFLSSYSNFSYARRAFQSGACDYILKTEMSETKFRVLLETVIQKRIQAGLQPSLNTENNKKWRQCFFQSLLKTNSGQIPGNIQELYDKSAFTISFPYYFMILRPGDIPQVYSRYKGRLQEFEANTESLLHQSVTAAGGICTAIAFDHYCVMLASELKLKDCFAAFYDTAWTYLDTGFEKKIGPKICSLQDFCNIYPKTASDFHAYSRSVVRARRYINENFRNTTLSLSDIADYSEVSKNHLSATFSKETGETVLDYIARVRIDAARKLLIGTDLLIFEIAEKTGYANTETFCRVFKKFTGKNPSRIRQ